MDTALQQLENIFTEETFTRKPLINYTVNYFTELHQIFINIKEENSINEMVDIAELHLSRNAQHIVSLYVMGFVSLEKKDFNDNNFERLINTFKNIKKWPIVEYLSKLVLTYYDSEYALKYLANYYQATNKDNEAVEVWEKLVTLDKDNYELSERIAHVKEKEGNLEEALKYYKIVFEHNLEKRRDKVIEANFKKILELNADCVSYFVRYESQIADVLEADAMIDLWKIIFFHYFENKNYEKSLKTIKHLFQYEQAIVKQNNKKAKYFRHRLVEVYNCLHPNHTLFKEIEEIAALTNVFKEPKAVIELFERYIKYDKDKYVYHREFGVGIITDINTESVFIRFAKNYEEIRKMTFEMAVKSLIVLVDDDILVYKAYKLSELKSIAEKTPNELITMVLKYRDGGTISSKDLKHDLVPDIIAETGYNKWLEAAKKSVRTNNAVKFEKNTFVYNISSLSYDEEMLIKFNVETTFAKRYETYIEYRDYTKDISCDEAKQMYKYFIDIAKGNNSKVDEAIISIMLINAMDIKDSTIPTVNSIINTVSDYTKVYEALPISQYKENYINAIYKNIENPSDIVKKFLYTSQVKYHNLIIDRLIEDNKVNLLEKTIDDIILKNREFTESFIFFAQSFLDKNGNKLGGKEIHYNKTFVIAGLLSLIGHLSKQADKKETSVSARKMLKVIDHLLFEKNSLLTFIDENDEEHVRIVFDEFQKLIDLENHYKTEINTAIARKFPNMI